jgi:hypothetical protein
MQRVPPEILEHIVRGLDCPSHDWTQRTSTLRALALSCRQLAPIAQAALFRTVTVHSAADCARLLTLSSYLKTRVRVLAVQSACEPALALFCQLAPHLPRVTTLSLSPARALDTLPELPAIASLVLRDLRGLALLACFRAPVRRLVLRGCGAPADGSWEEERARCEDDYSRQECVQAYGFRELQHLKITEASSPQPVVWLVRSGVAGQLRSLELQPRSAADVKAGLMLVQECLSLQHLAIVTSHEPGPRMLTSGNFSRSVCPCIAF